MRVAIAFLVVCGLVAFVSAIAAPSRPQVSEIFYAGTQVEIKLKEATIHGHGLWAADQPEGRNNEFTEIREESHKHYGFRSLFRYDLHRSYEVIDNRTCHSRVENGNMPELWGWLSQATYAGSKTVGNVTLDTWTFLMGYARLTLGVTAQDANRPQYLWVDAAERNTTIRFLSWNTDKPNEALFAVPKHCSAASPLDLIAADKISNVGCVSRGTMIDRAKVWVNNRVPYNQGGTYQGYREDCSGYVSMCWETSKPGYTTFTMHEIAHPISKDELQPGDVLLCASEHVVLFGGWSDGGRTHYQAYEETRPGEGTVTRVTPYPYWYNTGCFKPYRYNAVC